MLSFKCTSNKLYITDIYIIRYTSTYILIVTVELMYKVCSTESHGDQLDMDKESGEAPAQMETDDRGTSSVCSSKTMRSFMGKNMMPPCLHWVAFANRSAALTVQKLAVVSSAFKQLICKVDRNIFL